MTVIEKIDYIISYLGINEKKFAKQFRIPHKKLKAWRFHESEPTKDDVRNICAAFKLSEEYFLDNDVDISRVSALDDKCQILGDNLRHSNAEVADAVPEDYQRTDCSRYEEKD